MVAPHAYTPRMRPRRVGAIVPVVLLLGTVCSPPVASAATSCGTERALSGGRVFRVRATGANCTTAKAVAGGWFNVQNQSGEDAARTVFDQRRRRWKCRVTEEATGTDPGFIPFTSVQCTRRGSVVKFKLRS
jgi:hypothetical protein